MLGGEVRRRARRRVERAERPRACVAAQIHLPTDPEAEVVTSSPNTPSTHAPSRSPLPHLRADLGASLVVFLVAVPLSLGIALASGAPLLAGLIAAVVGGIVAGLLGGSPLQVSGPAAGLTVIVADLVTRFGWGVTCLITVGAGAVQVLFGVAHPPWCTGCSPASASRSRWPRSTSSWAARRPRPRPPTSPRCRPRSPGRTSPPSRSVPWSSSCC